MGVAIVNNLGSIDANSGEGGSRLGIPRPGSGLILGDEPFEVLAALILEVDFRKNPSRQLSFYSQVRLLHVRRVRTRFSTVEDGQGIPDSCIKGIFDCDRGDRGRIIRRHGTPIRRVKKGIRVKVAVL